MTPEQKIKFIILSKCEEVDISTINKDNVDDIYDETDDKYDVIYEVREGDVETGLPKEWSRHYESKSVAAQTPDGNWVGWTYWYGGGKHGEPEAIDWMEHAYDLTCVEEQKMVTVRTFKKAE